MIITYLIILFYMQVNNFVIFSDFFQDQPAPGPGEAPKRARLYMGKLQYV